MHFYLSAMLPREAKLCRFLCKAVCANLPVPRRRCSLRDRSVAGTAKGAHLRCPPRAIRASECLWVFRLRSFANSRGRRPSRNRSCTFSNPAAQLPPLIRAESANERCDKLAPRQPTKCKVLSNIVTQARCARRAQTCAVSPPHSLWDRRAQFSQSDKDVPSAVSRIGIKERPRSGTRERRGRAILRTMSRGEATADGIAAATPRRWLRLRSADSSGQNSDPANPETTRSEWCFPEQRPPVLTIWPCSSSNDDANVCEAKTTVWPIALSFRGGTY